MNSSKDTSWIFFSSNITVMPASVNRNGQRRSPGNAINRVALERKISSIYSGFIQTLIGMQPNGTTRHKMRTNYENWKHDYIFKNHKNMPINRNIRNAFKKNLANKKGFELVKHYY